jgi:phage shock protein C
MVFDSPLNYSNFVNPIYRHRNPIKNMTKLKYFVEYHVYGVCTRLGEKFGISTASIRLYFVYLSFITVGSPVVIYLILAFWMNIRRYLRQQNNPSVWEI